MKKDNQSLLSPVDPRRPDHSVHDGAHVCFKLGVEVNKKLKHLLPYGPSLHYPFVDKYTLGQDQNAEQQTWFGSIHFHMENKNKVSARSVSSPPSTTLQ